MTYTQDNRNPARPIPSGAPPGRANIDLGDDTAALIAAVPAMLGFRPENSMVFLGLSRSRNSADSPPGVSPSSSEVGPVVRADLVEGAVVAAARALVEANRNRADRSVIILVVGGDAGPLVDAAVREFREGRTPPAAAFLATDLRAGASWWEIPLDRAADDDGDREWHIGALPDPAESPAVGDTAHTAGQDPGVFPDQAQFERMLDRAPVPGHLRGILPESWRDGGDRAVGDAGETGGTGGTEEENMPDITALCGLVENLGVALSDGGVGDDSSTAGTVHDLLAVDGVAELLHRCCTCPTLAGVLVVLSVGPRGGVVRLLLTEMARVARGRLRHRALVLLSMAAWCGSGGVLAHRAVRRVLVESAGDATSGTVDLARELVRSAEQGRPAGVIAVTLDRGLRAMDETLTRSSEESAGKLLGRVLDRDSLSVVRSELARRAGR